MNIKIVICFIIIFFLPVASAGTGDVWAAKYSGFIKSDQPLSFENYQIKPKILDDTKASITVYRNQALIETREFNVNDFKKYDNIRISLLGIKSDYSWVSISKLETKDVWRLLARTQLKWGDTYSIENYKFNIDTFDGSTVNLIISNNSMSQTNTFSTNDSKDYENLRIAVRNINKTGFIEFEIFTNKAPEINADISTDKDEYFPNENVSVTINITSADVQNIVGINIESDPSTEIKPEMFSATGFKGTKSFQSHITQLPESSTITINGSIEVRDYFNNKYIVSRSKIINTTPIVSIIKRVPEETDEENVNVTLEVYNSGTTMENVSVFETIPEEFNLKPLSWRLGIEPGESVNLTYQISPQKPGQYIFPPATAKWKVYSTSSKQVVMNMHMPYLSMTKIALRNKSQTDVELVISNTGDRPAKVNVSDNIPPGYSIVNGDATWSKKLEGGESTAFQYSLQGTIETLPPADATYSDMHGIVRRIQSNAIEAGVKVKAKDVNAINDTKAPALKVETYDIVSFMISSFIGIAGIIAGVALTIYLINTLKRRK
ncbi:MAG: hypothetical protein PHU34_10580 [Candidatus Methanoperedens sp.]|nr:hypothetical protein [Candidatus Methanoperedens sp.]